ncbi:MAG: biotin transporter BioY [Oscillospiraceae bacterium]|nr:biotin transporter BioY [Oscillospiraceae bacterium]
MNTRKNIANLTAAAMFVALITLAGAISIPVPPSPSPVNFVDMFVILAGLCLGLKYGLATVATYIILGAIGVPVFSGLTGGWGILMTARGGFIFSFIPAVIVTGAASGRRSEMTNNAPQNHQRRLVATAITAALAYIIIFAGGMFYARYLATPNIQSWSAVLSMMLVPFIPGTVLKFGVILLLQRHVITQIQGGLSAK